MFQLMINEKGGQATSQSFEKNEITIGRVQGNDVVLPKGNISKRHSRIVLKDGKFIIVDLKSTNGTYVNGKKITAPQVIKATDKIYIGDYTIQLAGNGAAAVAAPAGDARAEAKKGGAKDEIDLFGGDAAVDDAPAPAAAAKAGAPGLIDDNFDQEFDIPGDAPPAKVAAGKSPSAVKKGGPKVVAEEPAPLALELDGEPDPDGDIDPQDLEADNGQSLDLEGNFGGDDSAAAAKLELEPDEPEPEPEEPIKPVVPIKPVKKVSTPAVPARANVSKAKGGKNKPEVEMEMSAPPKEPHRERPAPVANNQASALPRQESMGLAPVVQLPLASMGNAPPQQSAMMQSGPLDRVQAVRALHVQVVEELGLRGHELTALEGMRDRVMEVARSNAVRMQSAGRLLAHEDVESIASTVAQLATDFEVIAPLLADDKVVQIVVTHDRQIWAERESLEPEGQTFETEEEVVELIRRLGVLGGADPGPRAPLVDVRLRDGSRVIGVLPPLAFRGPTLSIRKPTRDAYDLDSFVEAGTLSESMAKFLAFCLRNKKNLLLSLGSGVSGSATLNALLASAIADDERVVTIETGVELHLHNLKNVTALEPTRDAPLGHIIRHATMLHPDHVIIGNVAGPDTFDVLAQLAGPLDGSVCSFSANSPREAVERLAHVELGMRYPHAPMAAKRLVASACPIVVQETRFAEGGLRRITAISELVVEGEDVVVKDIFVFRPEAIDENGVLGGSFGPTGYEPHFVQELVDRGEQFDLDMFKE